MTEQSVRHIGAHPFPRGETGMLTVVSGQATPVRYAHITDADEHSLNIQLQGALSGRLRAWVALAASVSGVPAEAPMAELGQHIHVRQLNRSPNDEPNTELEVESSLLFASYALECQQGDVAVDVYIKAIDILRRADLADIRYRGLLARTLAGYGLALVRGGDIEPSMAALEESAALTSKDGRVEPRFVWLHVLALLRLEEVSEWPLTWHSEIEACLSLLTADGADVEGSPDDTFEVVSRLRLLAHRLKVEGHSGQAGAVDKAIRKLTDGNARQT